MKRSCKKGQMKLSFGMIFSIIMIIIFLVFGFFVIQKFLGVKDSIEIGKFAEGLQNDIDKMWKSSQGSQPVEYVLPLDVEFVCFVDYSSGEKGADSNKYKELKKVYDDMQNLIFYPVGSGKGLDATTIEHLNLEKITEKENPFCVENKYGKVEMTIKKNFDDALVVVEK